MSNDYLVSGPEDFFINDQNSNFKLMPYDNVIVRPDPFFGMQKKVMVEGEVYYPGEYTILNVNENIKDIIERSGGLKPLAYPVASKFIRKNNIVNLDIVKILRFPGSSRNIKVQDGDKIIISRKPDMIELKGEVSSPGFYKYQKGLRVNDVISDAGGFSQFAEEDDVFITFPDGKSKQYSRWLSNPKIKDGSIITVGKKQEEEPFDKTEFSKEITAIIANILQAISLVLIARN